MVPNFKLTLEKLIKEPKPTSNAKPPEPNPNPYKGIR